VKQIEYLPKKKSLKLNSKIIIFLAIIFLSFLTQTENEKWEEISQQQQLQKIEEIISTADCDEKNVYCENRKPEIEMTKFFQKSVVFFVSENKQIIATIGKVDKKYFFILDNGKGQIVDENVDGKIDIVILPNGGKMDFTENDFSEETQQEYKTKFWEMVEKILRADFRKKNSFWFKIKDFFKKEFETGKKDWQMIKNFFTNIFKKN